MKKTNKPSKTDKSNLALSVKNLNAFPIKLIGNKKASNNQILFDVSFDLPKGKICTFIGHNGAGKTTTIKSILGLRYIQSGDIKILGVDAKLPASRMKVGYIPEKGNFERIKAINFLNNMGSYYGLTPEQVYEEAKEFLEYFKIPENRLQVRMNKLSSGQNMIITILQGFLGQPELIIADEPTNALDPESRDSFYDFIDHYHKKYPNITIFIVTHNLDEIEKITDYIVCIDHGKMMYQGNYDRSPGLRQKYRKMREKWGSK